MDIRNKEEQNGYRLKSYAIRSKNKEVLKSSTSGGLFTPIAEWVVREGGYVCAAAYADNYSVKHLIVSGGVYLHKTSKVPNMFKVA